MSSLTQRLRPLGHLALCKTSFAVTYELPPGLGDAELALEGAAGLGAL